MSLPRKSRKPIDLEADIPLTSADFEAMRQPLHDQDQGDLAAYLKFLDEIGAFTSKKVDVKIYSEDFEL